MFSGNKGNHLLVIVFSSWLVLKMFTPVKTFTLFLLQQLLWIYLYNGLAKGCEHWLWSRMQIETVLDCLNGKTSVWPNTALQVMHSLCWTSTIICMVNACIHLHVVILHPNHYHLWILQSVTLEGVQFKGNLLLACSYNLKEKIPRLVISSG